ncbi:glycosyltransferase [Gammaproteobacteria bacterium]|nr:glycosyltransferase [Gammaproteobacteria bacterium]
MKISIITAAFNATDTIADTIRSVSSQTHPEVEHIIIDGGSKDGTRDILDANIAFVDKVVSEPDEGLYYAMNKGIALASGDVIGILNADDVYAHDKVLERVAETIKVQGVQCCYADLVYVDRNNMNDVVRYWTSNTFVPGSFRRGWLPAHPTLFILRDVYEHYGSFDVDYKIQSDFELSMRFLEINRISSYYVPEIWVRMRMGGTTNRSLTNIIKGNLESYRACKKHGLGVGPMFFVTKIAQRLPQFFNRPG